MHPLLRSRPRQILDGTIRLPYVQDPNMAQTRNLQHTLIDRDSLRRIKTTASTAKCRGPLATPQEFITVPSGGVNTPNARNAGAHKLNARRSHGKTRGQSAGLI